MTWYGITISGGAGKTILSQKVLDDTNDVPKNYTILFKYVMGATSPRMAYFEIDVNVSCKFHSMNYLFYSTDTPRTALEQN